MSQVLLKIPGMHDVVEALLSYTQRHFVRMDRLVRSTFLLDYTLASMNVLMPNVGADSASLPGFEQLEAPGTDLDESTGTGVDADAFMQPAADVQADADVQAVLGEQRQAQAVDDSFGWQEDAGEAHGAQEPVFQKADTIKVKGSKRRKSAPQPLQHDSAAPKAGSQTAVKVKRKKIT